MSSLYSHVFPIGYAGWIEPVIMPTETQPYMHREKFNQNFGVWPHAFEIDPRDDGVLWLGDTYYPDLDAGSVVTLEVWYASGGGGNPALVDRLPPYFYVVAFGGATLDNDVIAGPFTSPHTPPHGFVVERFTFYANDLPDEQCRLRLGLAPNNWSRNIPNPSATENDLSSDTDGNWTIMPIAGYGLSIRRHGIVL